MTMTVADGSLTCVRPPCSTHWPDCPVRHCRRTSSPRGRRHWSRPHVHGNSWPPVRHPKYTSDTTFLRLKYQVNKSASVKIRVTFLFSIVGKSTSDTVNSSISIVGVSQRTEVGTFPVSIVWRWTTQSKPPHRKYSLSGLTATQVTGYNGQTDLPIDTKQPEYWDIICTKQCHNFYTYMHAIHLLVCFFCL